MGTDDRNTEIVKLAGSGIPHADIAVRFGISRPRVSQIVNHGDDQEAKDIRRLRRIQRELKQVSDNPESKTSGAFGVPTIDPDSCICGRRFSKSREHSQECQEQARSVKEQGTKVGALKAEAQMIAERQKARDRAQQADANQDALYREFMEYLSDLEGKDAENRALRAEVARLTVQLAAALAADVEVIG